MADTSIDFIKRWLDELPDDEIQAQIDDLGLQISQLSMRQSTLREALDMKKRFKQFVAPHFTENGSEPVEPDTAPGPGLKPKSIKESVLTFMASDPAKEEWTTEEFHKGLKERGWLDKSTQAYRSLGAALSRMTTDGEIERASRGVYKRAATTEAALQGLFDLGGETG